MSVRNINNDYIIAARNHVKELVKDRNMTYQSIRIYKDKHPLLFPISDDIIFEWCKLIDAGKDPSQFKILDRVNKK